MPDREVYIDQVDYEWVEKNHKLLAKKLREIMINKLTLQDTATYRNLGLESEGKYKHEPPKFRFNLYSIYDSLSDSKLEELYNLRILK
jgi:hypothetical protein